jgi:hypothetical protein
MLARLLRWLWLSLLLAGVLLGWLLTRQTGSSGWWILATALLLPFATVLLVIVVSAVLSRAAGANALWWRALLGEFWASVRVFLLQHPQAKNFSVFHLPSQFEPASARAAQSGIAVLLVHGYVCNHRLWDAMIAHLRSAGHPVIALSLEPLFVSIDQYAPLIEQAVADLCQQTGSEKVALVGHSMGGLAIRAWLRMHGNNHVAKVITLGTPHAGTKISRFTRTTNGQQMAWQSSWLQTLENSETPATRSLMHIALTPQDNIVYPQREQVLTGVPVTVFEGLGHLQLCLNRDVIAWVIKQLEATAPTVERPGSPAVLQSVAS